MKKIEVTYYKGEPVYHPIEMDINGVEIAISLIDAKELLRQLQDSIEACEHDVKLLQDSRTQQWYN